MQKTASGFAAFAKAAFAAGCGYVYGTNGQRCTKALLDAKAKQYPSGDLAGGAMRTAGNKWIGKPVMDCCGLLEYYINSSGVGHEPTGTYNTTANAIFNAATVKGPISSLPNTPGICLHMSGHFGVYIGNGEAIEAMCTTKGVVKTKVAGRGWTNWFKVPCLTY